MHLHVTSLKCFQFLVLVEEVWPLLNVLCVCAACFHAYFLTSHQQFFRVFFFFCVKD